MFYEHQSYFSEPSPVGLKTWPTGDVKNNPLMVFSVPPFQVEGSVTGGLRPLWQGAMHLEQSTLGSSAPQSSRQSEGTQHERSPADQQV